MKKLSLLLILFLFLCIDAYSQKVAYAVLKDSTLTFYYGKNKPEGAYDVENLAKNKYDEDDKKWNSVSHQIKTVVFDQSFKKYKPKSCSQWFNYCGNLTSVIGIKENLNTSEVTNMSSMFFLCVSLTSLDVSGFNTKNVTDMSFMFGGYTNLTSLDVSGFNTENVTDMSFMFDGCANLSSIDVSGFNTENVTDMREMFSHCENLKSIYVGDGWNTSNVTDSEYMFNNCPNLVGGQGTEYDENHIDASYAHIDGGESNPGYLTKKTK